MGLDNPGFMGLCQIYVIVVHGICKVYIKKCFKFIIIGCEDNVCVGGGAQAGLTICVRSEDNVMDLVVFFFQFYMGSWDGIQRSNLYSKHFTL